MGILAGGEDLPRNIHLGEVLVDGMGLHPQPDPADHLIVAKPVVQPGLEHLHMFVLVFPSLEAAFDELTAFL